MAKPRPQSVQIPIKQPDKAPVALGTSKLYQVEKYGLYGYQLYRVDPVSGARTKIGEENVFNVVCSGLVDLLFNDINPEHLK